MSDLITPEYHLIDNNKLLHQAVLEWQSYSSIAIDTEFVRTNTYYPKIGLIQVAVNKIYYLIDPLKITDYQPLKDLLQNQSIVKVFHACAEDLDVFQSYLGVLPEPIFDTQIAAALLGQGRSTGYKNLVKLVFDIDLPKEEQRSNWLKRPLSGSQLIYAVMDVVYLEDIYQQQLDSLTINNRLAWVQEESNLLLIKQRNGVQPELFYQRIKGAQALSADALAILQALAEWREYKVRDKDLPRGFLIKDATLLAISHQQPKTEIELAVIEGISSKLVRQYGKELLAIMLQVSLEHKQVAPIDDALTKKNIAILKKMQGLIADLAVKMQLEVGTLMSKKLLIKLLTRSLNTGALSFPPEMGLWKQNLIGDDLEQLLTDLDILS